MTVVCISISSNCLPLYCPLPIHTLSKLYTTQQQQQHIPLLQYEYMNTIMHMAVVGYFPRPLYSAYICCAGMRGYTAFIETLEVGRPDQTMLVSTRDTTVALLSSSPNNIEVSSEDGGDAEGSNLPTPTTFSFIYSTISSSHNNNTLTHSTPDSSALEWQHIVPTSCRHLSTTGAGIHRISSNFLTKCPLLKSIQLDGLCNVVIIDESFMEGCCGLTFIDLTPLRNVKRIEANFMLGCSGLKSIDLSPIGGDVVIGSSFLEECRSLETIKSMNVISKKGNFLQWCCSLTTLNLEHLLPNNNNTTNTTTTAVGWSFLSGCTGLRALDLSPLCNVTELGSSFLEGCSGLISLDLTPLSKVTLIRMSFLAECTGLTSVNLEGLRNATATGWMFMAGCSSLTSIDLSPLCEFTEIGASFMSGCTSLTSIDLTPLSNVRVIKGAFLEGCCSLASIDVTPLVNVERVEYPFLQDCDGLVNIKANGVSTVILTRLPQLVTH